MILVSESNVGNSRQIKNTIFVVLGRIVFSLIFLNPAQLLRVVDFAAILATK